MSRIDDHWRMRCPYCGADNDQGVGILAEHVYPAPSTPARYLAQCRACQVYTTVGFLKGDAADGLSFAEIRKARAVEAIQAAFDAAPIEAREEWLAERARKEGR